MGRVSRGSLHRAASSDGAAQTSARRQASDADKTSRTANLGIVASIALACVLHSHLRVPNAGKVSIAASRTNARRCVRPGVEVVRTHHKLSVRCAPAIAPYLSQLSVIRWVREHADRTLQELDRPPQLACTVRKEHCGQGTSGPGSDERVFTHVTIAPHTRSTSPSHHVQTCRPHRRPRHRALARRTAPPRRGWPPSLRKDEKKTSITKVAGASLDILGDCIGLQGGVRRP